MQCIAMLGVAYFIVVLAAVMPNVILLSVVAPFNHVIDVLTSMPFILM